jgi:hypothetical protein
VIRDFTNDPRCCVYVRQESNLHALSWAPESESGTSFQFRHGRLTPTKCARQELNLHARIGHPGLSRARLPKFPPRARMPPLCSSQRSDETGLFACQAAMHTNWSGCGAVNDVATRNASCKPNISTKPVMPQANWVQPTTGMSGDIPNRANSKAERYMRFFFKPLLPAGAHAH